MSFDFRRICTKNGRIWVTTQADWPLLGRPAWHPYTCCHVFNPGAMWHEYNASESWIGCQFDQMDRKSLAWIKRPTSQLKPTCKSVIHLSGQIISMECNVGTTEDRDVSERGPPASGRPASLARARVKAKQPTPTPWGDQERPEEGGGQMATSPGRPA
jgi:hypothetical protein